MASPFPGMNPYLEHPNIWDDFHASLATEIRNQLAPNLRPRYFAALIPRVTYDEVVIEDMRIDYSQPPPKPDLPPEDAGWLEARLLSAGGR